MSVSELRELALREVGRRTTLELEPIITTVSEHLEPGERIEAVAGATLDRFGLRVVTDRRVLVSRPEGFKRQAVWSALRADVRGAAANDASLWLDAGDEPTTLRGAWLARRWGFGHRFVYLFDDGPHIDGIRDRALAGVLELYCATRPRLAVTHQEPPTEFEGVLPIDMASERLGTTLHQLRRAVTTALEERGLLTHARMERTEAGREADRRLDTWLRLAVSELPARAGDFDVASSRAFLEGAGASVLLVEAACPALAQLGERGIGAYAGIDVAQEAVLNAHPRVEWMAN